MAAPFPSPTVQSRSANAPGFADLDCLSIGEIAGLPPELLLELQTAAEAETARVKRLRDRLQAGIAERYAATAQAERTAQGKDTGTVRFEDAGITVVAELPKKVTWDQARLAAIAERIRAAGDDPSQYVEIAYRVPERKYAAWPEAIRQQFEPARTVHTGALKIAMTTQGGGR